MNKTATVSDNNSTKKVIMCINTTSEAGEILTKIFKESALTRKLGSMGEYTTISTWLKVACVYLAKNNPSAKELYNLFQMCKSDEDLLSYLKGEKDVY